MKSTVNANVLARRIEVQKEINARKVQIDRKCFEKTPEERLALKEAKAIHKMRTKKAA